jgi:hypothetical protein
VARYARGGGVDGGSDMADGVETTEVSDREVDAGGVWFYLFK